MVKIPTELKEKEVEKFETLDIFYNYEYTPCKSDCENLEDALYISDRIVIIRKFYTQPFEPEMIVKYFEGICTVKSLSIGNRVVFDVYNSRILIKKHRDGQDIRYSVKVSLMDYKLVLCEKFSTSRIVTLSDFIDSCINSEIKLVWKND